MKINVEDFEDFIRNETWRTYASETIDFENHIRLRLFYNANGLFRVTKGSDELYHGSDINETVEMYNTFSN